ncbi:hypothetical protein HN51_056393 [Arachis hypogaea]|uniref:Lipid-transfer protein n=1 Tax=Arachis hypogaea TaxID=3818 RepID=A0A6B9VGB8_ARAHY|nr:Putative lipid-transfer protein [Arachis hypogaea]
MRISSMVALSIMALTLVAVLHGCMAAQLPSECNIRDLIPCKPALTEPNPLPPSEVCCSLLSKGDLLKCLCRFKDSPLLPSMGIDPNLVVLLPKKCHLPQPFICLS